MGRHAAPAGPEGREVRRRFRGERRRPRYPGGFWRYFTGGLAFAAAGGYLESTDVPWYLHPVQAAFFGLLPLAVLNVFGTFAANFLAERRARRCLAARPRVNSLFLALGWALISGACALLAWAAGAWPAGRGGQDWIATGLIWGMVISACAAVMLIGRAIPTGMGRRPAWLAGVGVAGVAGVAGAGGVGTASDVFGLGGAVGGDGRVSR
jgi:hypothetical protein